MYVVAQARNHKHVLFLKNTTVLQLIMQDNHKITVERCPQQENMISQCSCTECDSIGCFVKRQAEEPLCTCETCKSSTSCLFHNINLDDTKLSNKDIEDLAIEFAVENLAREIIKKQIIYELTTSNNEQTIKKQSKLTYKIPNQNDLKNGAPENAATTSFIEASLPKAQLSDGVLNMQYKDPKKYKAINAKSSKVRNTKSNAVAANNLIKQASSSHVKLIAKIANMQSENSQNDKINNFRDSKSKYDKPNSVDARNVFKETTSSIAKLSAEVMNMHYKDSQKTLTKPSDISNIISIINKIKEAYKACSCKVCECIVGKSLDNERCKCKPCECSDCTSFNYKHARTISERLFPTSGDECSCAVCVKRSCQEIGNSFLGKQASDCTAVLKNNNLFGSASFRQPCNCEPCQCIDCRTRFISRQGLVVAPVIENQNRSACDCSPCECGECIPARYGLSSNPQNEISTSVDRHPQCQCEMCSNEACVPDGNQFCRCERQSRVMSKPFQQNTRDYDIRRTNVSYSNVRHKNNRDTIAMYATVMKSYPNQTEKDYLNSCYCDQCECLNCKDSNNTKNTNANSKRSACANPIKLFDAALSLNPKNECKFCKHQVNATHLSKLPNSNTNYGYSVCSCLSHTSLVCPMAQTYDTKKPKSKFSAKVKCECNDCKTLMSTDIENKCTCSNGKTEKYVKVTYSDEFVYPVKRGELLTPAIFKRKIHDALIETCSNTTTNDKIAKQLGILKSSLKKSSTVKSCKKPTLRDNDLDALYEKCSFQETRADNPMLLSSYFSQAETVKHTKSRYCDEQMMPKYTELPDLSLHSSIPLSKQSGSPPSRSSYRDYPSYLVHYPKKVNSCFNDSMRLDNANNIDLVSMSLQSKNGQQNMCSDFNVQNYMNNQPTKPFSFKEPTPHNKSPKKYFSENDNGKLNSTRTASSYSDSNMKPTNYAYLKTFFENLGLNKDYVRIQNILRETRAFSSQLLQLLEKYDKANREFESVSKKFKTPNYIIQNVITIEENLNDALEVDDIPTKDFKTSSTNISVEVNKNIKKINVLQFLNKYESFDDEKGETVCKMNLSNACNDTNEGRDESGDDTSKIDNAHLNTFKEEKEHSVKLNHKHDMTKNVAKLLQNKYQRSYTQDRHTINRTGNIYSLKQDTPESNNITAQEVNIPYETYRRPTLERNNIIEEEYPKNVHMLVEVTDFQKHFEQPSTALRVPNSENVKEPTIEQNKEMIDWTGDPWPILKKNFCLSNKLSSQSEAATPMEKHVKTAQKMISKQPNDENATYLYKNKALISAWRRNKQAAYITLLDRASSKAGGFCHNHHFDDRSKCVDNTQKEATALHLAMQCKHDIVLNSLSKASSSQTIQDVHSRHSPNQDKAVLSPSISRNSCDSFKVNFLNVRQVSHHTLLVKWSAPNALDNVEGYELLVDGRAVKKILCPTRCMAVVTCLHSGKVLLTVRTVMNAPCPEHCPAATVIYQPRVK